MTIPILADASLPILTEAFPAPFQITAYDSPQHIPELLPGKSILLCRSTLPINSRSLPKTEQLEIVATASSGIDHIDTHFLTNQQVHVLDAKGSNADAVTDYVMASLAYLRINCAFEGKTAGIIGAGAVGIQVGQRLEKLGIRVIYYDPVRALSDTSFRSNSLEALQACDLICIHANLHDTLPHPSRHLISDQFLQKMVPESVIINAARGDIVDERAIIEKLFSASTTHASTIKYCTDVYCNEPAINSKITQLSTLCTPHIAGHSIEAKLRAITLLSQKIHQYYHLPPPALVNQPVSNTAMTKINLSGSAADWEQQILNFYNPLQETLILKQALADNISEVFLRLRRQHQFRHELTLEK